MHVDDGAGERPPTGRGRKPPLSVRPSWVLLSIGMVLVVGFGPFAGVPVLLGVSFLALIAIVYGPRRNRSTDQAGWWMLFTSGVINIIGDGIRGVLGPAASQPPLMYLPDGFSLVAYGLLATFIVRLAKMRGLLQTAGDVLDTTLISLGTWIVLWITVVDPALHRPGLPLPAQLISAAYPCISIAVSFVLGALLTAATRKARPGLAMITCGAVSLAAADLTWSLNRIGISIPANVSALLYVSMFLLGGSAALHPSMTILPRAGATGRSVSPARMAAVGSSLLVPPVAYAVHDPVGLLSTAVVTATTVAMTAVVILRMIDAIRAYTSAQQSLAWQATHDPLTGIPNRALLETRLAAILDGGRGDGVAVLFFDLDRFKNVNDTYGHAVGDELLCAVTARLQATLRHSDLIARVSGDEFVAVFTGVTCAADAYDAGRRVLGTFAQAYPLSSGPMVVSSSIGAAFAGPDRPVSVEVLLNEADQAMYRSKQSGRGQVSLYDGAVAVAALRRSQVEEHLAGAADRDELSMRYQPVVEQSTGQVVGYEALMRWTHPELGAVGPDEFIAAAEESGQIVGLGRWSLQTAIAQLAVWQQTSPDLTMAVNLSAWQLRDQELVGIILDTLDRLHVPAPTLTLEVTEQAMLRDADQADQVFTELTRAGVRLALDDFGTGYSSMSFLRRYPISEVKIHESYVTGLGDDDGDEAICRAVIALAGTLGLQVSGEGVETAVQRDRLVGLGCTRMQGRLYSPALPPSGIDVRAALTVDRGIPA
jgi:diguanylate cyclase (GGDEF)-like protein